MTDGRSRVLRAVAIGQLVGKDVAVTAGCAGSLAIWTLDEQIDSVIEIAFPLRAIKLLDDRRIAVGGPAGVLTLKLDSQSFDRPLPRKSLGLPGRLDPHNPGAAPTTPARR
jgi:hypothetical protein